MSGHFFSSCFCRLKSDLLLSGLLLLFLVLAVTQPVAPASLVKLVDWHTIGVLSGLMVLSRGLEDSGALAIAGRWLLSRMATERGLAAALVVFSAALSAIITNDVALFIVVPLTLSLGLVAHLPLGRLIIFEALAVNAGSAISPVGNPQNLYLWQISGESMIGFVQAMAPVTLWMMILLLVLTRIGFGSRPINLQAGAAPTRTVERPLLMLSLACYPAFLILAELGQTLAGVVVVLAVFLLRHRAVLRGVDWVILLVFILMFINLGLIAQLPLMARIAASLMALPGELITGAAMLSQLISNVPATIFLAEFTGDWKQLAWGANVGGFGLAIGSMANLIALRLGSQRGLWVAFHGWSIPMLVLSLSGAWLML